MTVMALSSLSVSWQFLFSGFLDIIRTVHKQEKPMSKADIEFINMCRDILENGTSTEGQKVRPHWPDGTPAYTIMKFGEINRFDLREEFPMLTLRKTGIKSATD